MGTQNDSEIGTLSIVAIVLLRHNTKSGLDNSLCSCCGCALNHWNNGNLNHGKVEWRKRVS